MRRKEVGYLPYILVGLLVLTVLLSTAFNGMFFKKGMPFPELNAGEITLTTGTETTAVSIPITQFGKIFILTIIGAGSIWIIYKVIKKLNWKSIRRPLLVFFLILSSFAGVLYLFFLLPHRIMPFEEITLPPETELQFSPLGETPPILFWFAGILLFICVVYIAVRLVRSPDKKEAARNSIEFEALLAINELEKGKDLRDVIIVCYRNMCEALRDEQEIERDSCMTVEEFETRITAAGIPEAPVRRLTNLFEAVRYGTRLPNREDEENALSCFNAIIDSFAGIKDER